MYVWHIGANKKVTKLLGSNSLKRCPPSESLAWQAHAGTVGNVMLLHSWEQNLKHNAESRHNVKIGIPQLDTRYTLYTHHTCTTAGLLGTGSNNPVVTAVIQQSCRPLNLALPLIWIARLHVTAAGGSGTHLTFRGEDWCDAVHRLPKTPHCHLDPCLVDPGLLHLLVKRPNRYA